MAAQIFIVAAVLCMYGLREIKPLIPNAENPLLSLALVAVQILFVTLLAFLLNRVGLIRLARPHKEQGQLGGYYRRLGLLLQIVLLLLFAGDIYLAGWADLATMLTGAVPILADELLILLPLLLSWLIVQAILYGLDRAVRLRARQGAQSRQIWSRKRYLLFHIQAGLAPVLILLSLLLALIDLLDLIGPHLPSGSLGDALISAILILGIGLTVLCAPVLIRFTWSCAALKDSPIRKRLENLCTATGLGYRNILVWRTGKMITNAAVMGFWGPLRYLLITDALLEEMSPDELAAVFAHEVGHVSGRHLPYYGLFLVGLNLVIYDLRELLIGRLSLLSNDAAIDVLQIAVLVGAFLVIFGWISRRFERDADVRAILHSGCPDGGCQPGCPLYDLRQAEEGHNPTGNPGERLCPLAVRCFSGALNRIGALNAIPRRARSWRHSSIASRTELLQQLTCEPGRLHRFQRLIRLVKICIWAAVVAGAIGAILLYLWPG